MALMTVLADVILPSGQINKYVKGMMSIVLLIVLVSPLVALVRQDVDVFDLINLDKAGYTTDQAYIDMIDDEHDERVAEAVRDYPSVYDWAIHEDVVVVYVVGDEPLGLRQAVADAIGKQPKDVMIYATAKPG